jgi:cell division septal protein FtsQ
VSSQRPRTNRPTPSVRRPEGVRPGMRIQALTYLRTGRPLSILLLFVVLWSIYAIWNNPAFAVTAVTVTGASTLSGERVAELTGAVGASIWSLDAQTMRTAIVASPYVVSADVAVYLPNTVTVSLNEHESEIRWKNGSSYLIVDPTGALLGIDPAVVITGTLIINDDSAVYLSPGDTVDAQIVTLARVISQRLPTEAGIEIARIGWDERRGISVVSATGQTVLFGTLERIDEKLALLAQLNDENASFAFADLRSLTPYYRADIPFTETITQTLVISDAVEPAP